MRLQNWLFKAPLRLRSLFRRGRAEQELNEELEYHLERKRQECIARGMTPEEAHYQALRAMDGLEQRREECRDMRRVNLIENLFQDIRYGTRVLRKSPGFTIVAVLSLALGIGANTAIFSLIDAVMLRMLPVQNPEELLVLTTSSRGSIDYGFTYRRYQMFREQNRAFRDLAASSPLRLNVSVDGEVEPTVAGQMVSGSYFSVLGVNAIAGRTIGLEDDRVPQGHPVAMLSYMYWDRRFARSTAIIGKRILLDGTPFTVIGVTPPEFFGIDVGSAPDVWVPVMMQPTVMPAAENWLANPINTAHWLRIVGRLKPRIPEQQALAEMDVLFQRDSNPSDRVMPGEKLRFAPAGRGLSDLRRQFSEPLFILMTVVGLVLLIACANVASMLLARATARQQELAVRLAIGAGRWRLVRQLLVESLLLSFLGGVCGIAVAFWGSQTLLSFISRGRAAINLDLHPDLRVLAFTALVSILTGILFGIAPALRATRLDLTPALKSKSRLGGNRAGSRLGNILVIGQVALSLLLLIVAGLVVRSLQNLNNQDAGFERESVLVLRVEPRGSDQKSLNAVRLDRIYRDLQQRVEALAGVRSASLSGLSPTAPISLKESVKMPSGDEVSVSQLQVYPRYFTTMGLAILSGRDFRDSDLAENAPLVVVINESMARRLFNGENPVGQTLVTKLRRSYVNREIIGVVKDSKYSSLRGETQSVAYQPFFQTNTGRGQMVLHVRVVGNASAIVPGIKNEVLYIEKDLPMFEVQTLAAEVDAALMQERVIATLSGFFGIAALILAAVGLYGLMAFTVVRRTGEIGIRMAMGAQRGAVLWMVMRDTLVLVFLGVIIGIPVALTVLRLSSSHISGLLFGLRATDPITLAMAVGLMTSAAMISGYVPARRASRVDPMVALRNE
jgi:predicted permease